MADHKLGALTFRLWMGPPPPLIKQTVEAFSHPGVDYEGFRWLGKRSGDIVRESRADAVSLTAARALLASYYAALEGGPYQLIWSDYDYDTEGQRAVVRDVEMTYLRKHQFICGAQTPGNTWELRVDWTLRLTPYP